ncbi:MAG TPA: UdgX family uracil-DNA binding protein [Nevskiaceae bacterium]|nr:UdgX family uracil-DNA binding protein [Nevskiaceae bacterium]
MRKKAAAADDFPGAQEFLPAQPTLPAMSAAVQDCRGCPLYAHATQAVFGEGKESAKLVLIGEQPGNDEDLAGQPFIGPAGKLLDRALVAAGIERAAVYVTNAVKHFKFEPRGKRRLHSRPGAREIKACLPWLQQELELIRPLVIVCPGATAAQALLGKTFRLTQHRGEVVSSKWSPRTLVTAHPSSILRQRTHQERERAFSEFVSDLKAATAFL